MKQRNTEIEVLRDLRNSGYRHNLIISDGKLYVDEVKGNGYTPEQCLVEKEYRFEGMTNPSDTSIIYAVAAPGPKKGTVVVGYGPNASSDAADFFRNVRYAVSQ